MHRLPRSTWFVLRKGLGTVQCYRGVQRAAEPALRLVTLTHPKQGMCTKADGFAFTAWAVGTWKGFQPMVLFPRRMCFI